MELTRKTYSYREEEEEEDLFSRDFRRGFESDVDRRPGLWPPENKADNRLLRQERMGCGWFGVIFEWEGVLVEDDPDLENQAWLALSQEVGKSPPPVFDLRRIEGMKSEQAMEEVLCWSKNSGELKRMASRKEKIYQALQGGIYRFRSGSQEFVNVLMDYKIPMALVSTRPRKSIEKAIRVTGIEGVFSVVVAAEDVHRGKPDPEMFEYAAQCLRFIPERCIVFGNSNLTIEAAIEARMKCVAVASKHPVYELGSADLVVMQLDEVTVVDLKSLANVDSPEVEMEFEAEKDQYPSSSVGVFDDDDDDDDDDDFW